jgi:hypothetical protein
MTYTTEEILDRLVSHISGLPMVQSVGLSGKKTPLPKKGEGDIDLFIYCDEIPALARRQEVLDALCGVIEEGKADVIHGGRWGYGDFALLNGVETWLMYFTMEETLADAESILKGEQPDKLDNYYYPVGRLAMLKNMTVLFDRSGFLSGLKNRLASYPEKLRNTLAAHHLSELHDTEDLCRAVTRRDAFFYHFALDIALDHFLQALFAMNSTYFPSRKRTLEYLASFSVQPKDCASRLMEVLRLGGKGETVPQSYSLFQSLADELMELNAPFTGNG